MTQNRWRSVDANFQDGVGSVLLSFFAIKAANAFFMTIFNLSPPRIPTIHDRQTLTFRWCLLSKRGTVCVSIRIDHKGGQYIKTELWLTDFIMLQLTVAYLNVVWNGEREMQNWWLDRMGLPKPSKTPRIIDTGPGLARQEAAGLVFGWLWDWTNQFLRSKSGQLVGNIYPLLTLLLDAPRPPCG